MTDAGHIDGEPTRDMDGVIPSGPPTTAERLADAPATIDQWTITGVLGWGGMGVVYRATQEVPRRDLVFALDRLARGHEALEQWDESIAALRKSRALAQALVEAEPDAVAVVRLYVAASTRLGQLLSVVEEFDEAISVLQGVEAFVTRTLTRIPDDLNLLGNQAGATLSLAEALQLQSLVVGLDAGAQRAFRVAATEAAHSAIARLETIAASVGGHGREAKAIAEAQAIIEACNPEQQSP